MIETEYRGHRIIYSENQDNWYASDIQNSDAPTLSKVKAKIDKMYLDMRKRSAFNGFEISGHGEPTLTPTTIVEYVKEKVERSWSDPSKITSRSHIVAAVAQRGGREKAARRQCNLDEIAPDTPETMVAFENAKALWVEMRRAEKAYRDAVAAIPRVSFHDITDLVKASSSTLGDEE